jgi:hypothetical protein
LSTTDAGKQLVDWIPSRHSDHVAALEGHGWDDNCNKRRQDALSVQHRRKAANYGCAKRDGNQDQKWVVQPKENPNKSGDNQHCQMTAPRVPVAVRPGSVLQRSASKFRLVGMNERLIGPLAAGIDCVSCRVGLAEIGREGADVYRIRH